MRSAGSTQRQWARAAGCGARSRVGVLPAAPEAARVAFRAAADTSSASGTLPPSPTILLRLLSATAAETPSSWSVTVIVSAGRAV